MSRNDKNIKKKRMILLVAGGTGGHVFPAESMAEHLLENYEVNLVTDARGARFVSGALLNVKTIKILARGFSGSWSNQLYSILLLSVAFVFLLFKFLFQQKPSLIIGFGGYPSVAAILAGYVLNVPIIVHEQNAVLGKANKFLSKFADVIALSFRDTQGVEVIPNYKVFYTGNPIRQKVSALVNKAHKKIDQNAFRILVIGGSQGAAILSRVVPQALQRLKPHLQQKIYTYQQVRSDLLYEAKKLYDASDVKAEIKSFFKGIDALLHKCDLVISRAGAATLTEIIAARKPAILVPFAAAQNNHQFFNAKFLCDQDAAILIKEIDFTPEKLHEVLENIMTDGQTMPKLQTGIRKIKAVNASQELLLLVSKFIALK